MNHRIHMVNLLRTLIGMALLLPPVMAVAVPVASPDTLAETRNEDFGTEINVFRLEDYFTDSFPGHTITSYGLQSVSGDSVATVVVDPSTGQVDLTSIDDAFGTQVFTFVGTDNVGLEDTLTLTLTVDPVNDEPSFTGGGDVASDEDAGGQSLAWASAISPGPGEAAVQSVSFNIVSNSNVALFDTLPAIDSAGTLSYRAAADANGSATITVELQDDGGTANGGDDTSPTQSFTITVNPVNDQPSFSSGADQSVLEDAGAQTVAGWASGMNAGPANESAQILSFNVSGNTNPGLFSVAPAIDPTTGDLTYTAAGDAFGDADITITLSDSGGTANGGVDTSAPATFRVTVDPVNDAPTFTAGADQMVLEDAGAQTVAAWATAMSPGPGNEGAQTLTFNVTANDNPGLFSTPPAVDAVTGDLTFAPAADAIGIANITLELQDDGGTVDGGADTSTAATFSIEVGDVNDAPSFTAGGDVTVDEDAGSFAGVWATSISAGPPDEAGQTLTFSVVSNSNPALFATPPAIDAAGALTFTSTADEFGSADITVELSDDGGTANGGVDVSAQVTFTITVDPVNDAPAFVNGGDVSALEDSGAQTFPAWATGLSVGPANEAGQSLAFNVVGISDPSLFSSPPAVDGVSGDLTFALAPDANGSATVTLNLQDSGGIANGGTDTSSPDDTFTITVASVNDAPSFDAGGDVSVSEDAGAQTVAGWASNISAGPADESAQTLTFNITGNTNPAMFATQPSVDPTTGDLTFAAAAESFGSSTITLELVDNGGTADGGIDTSSPVSFLIGVADVNDEPSFVAGGNQTVLEDAGAVTIPGWASSLSPGPANESGQVLTFTFLGNTNPGLFAAGPAVDGTTGDLTFTPAPDLNGSSDLTVSLSDDGGTLNGGDDTAPPVSFSIAVTAVNDAPTFTGGPSITVDEDAGAQTFTGWASGMSPGPADESGQVLTFDVVGNTQPGLFSVQPAVDPSDGTLTFTTAPDQAGTTTVTLRLTDDGGIADGGQNASADQTFEITLSPVNDVPVAADDSVTMAEDDPPITIAVLGNDYLAEEPTTIVSAGVDGNSESDPTTVLNQTGDPITAPNGQVSIVGNTIQYQPKQDFYGVDFFTYTIRDSDGDESSATVTVTVNAVNDPPVGVQERSYFVQENGSLVVNAATGLLVGSYDVDGALLDSNGDPIGATISVQIVTFPTVGTLNIDQTTGTFDYTPPVNFVGTVEFEYRLSDGTLLSTGDAYRVRVVVLEAPEPPAPPPAGEVAIPFSLANVPLEQSTSVPPNVLVVMDDSGSMDWNLIVAGAGADGGFELSNAYAANSGLRSASYKYLWDLDSNAYPPSSGNGGILPTEAALQDEADDRGWPAAQYGVWRGRNHMHNRVYYNPNVQYTPWIGQDANNEEFTDADPAAIRLDPVDPTNLFDMLALHSYRAYGVPEWDSNGGTENIDVDDLYIPHYYATTATPPLAWDDPHTLVEIRPGNGPFVGGPDREDCAADDGNPLDCTYEQEIQNFANYFQYYRSREYVTKNGIGKTVAQVQDVRIGYETISNTSSEPVREMNSLHTEGNKKLLMDNIYRVDSYGGTPLRQALGRAGDIFSCQTGNDCPALPTPEGFCQQNFALLFSDGYWNGGTGTTGNPDGDADSDFDGGRYADTTPATLADVAMHYYETDLFPTRVDEVPATNRDINSVPDGVFPAVDAKMHQHMKTYAIAFGVAGTVDPASIPSNPATPFAWPDPFSGSVEKIDDMLHAAINGRGRFLSAGTPQELQAAFESAFLEFTQAASSTSAAAFNSTSLRDGTLLYRGFYDLRDNTGELTATEVFDDGSLAASPTWRAADRLDSLLPNNRVIVTYDPVARSGIPFRHVSLTADQQSTLDSEQVNYLRGVRTNEEPAGGLRERPANDGLLGDIVNSSPVFVGEPRAINRDQAPYPVGDLYSEFADSVSTRDPVVYVGANDGMLHGFNALTGDEMYAYVPNKIIDDSQGYKNPLDLFTSPFYQHRYYVDLTPRLNDAYMRASPSAIGKSWNSVLVGGLGAGGKGLYALNVTDPGDFSTEGNATSTVLWEFTDQDDTYPVDASGNPLGGSYGAITDPTGAPVKDLGYTLSLPTVAMSNIDDGGSPSEKDWVAILGNGPNSTAGIAKLFVLLMDGGFGGWGPGDFIKLDTGFGVQSPPHPLAGYPNGLGSPALVDRDLNGTVDWVYAGDRLGNLFRFDLSDPDPGNWTTTRLFTATYDTGAGETIQPILTQPLVIKHPTEQGFLVIFGTGSYLTREDADSEDIQSIYAIWDRGANSPATAQDDTKSERLIEQTITNVVDDSVSPAQTRRIVSRNPVNYQLDDGDDPGTYGWYIDFDMPRASTTLSGAANPDISGRNPPDPQFPGERAIRRMLFRDGTVITTTVLPSLDEFSCFGTRPGSIILFDAVTGGDAGRPVVDFNTDGYVDDSDLVSFGGDAFAGGLLFNQSDLDGQLVDLSTLGGEGDTDFLFVSGGNDTVSFRIDDINDSRTGRLSWRELDGN